MAKHGIRDVDVGAVHSFAREPFIQATACLPDEGSALDRFRAARRLSHDDPVRPGRAVTCHEGAVSKGALAAASERSLSIHTEVLGMEAVGLSPWSLPPARPAV